MTDGVKVGVGVFVLKDNKVLFQQRKGSIGEYTFCPPGGHLEFGESFEACAKRETKEECGLDVEFVKLGPTTNDFFENENKHYVTVFVICKYISGVPKVCEPDKCVDWIWVDWKDLPKPLFLPIQNLVDIKYNPFDELE